jgi:hypothetical protein
MLSLSGAVQLGSALLVPSAATGAGAATVITPESTRTPSKLTKVIVKAVEDMQADLGVAEGDYTCEWHVLGGLSMFSNVISIPPGGSSAPTLKQALLLDAVSDSRLMTTMLLALTTLLVTQDGCCTLLAIGRCCPAGGRILCELTTGVGAATDTYAMDSSSPVDTWGFIMSHRCAESKLDHLCRVVA